uniref:Uncharacterized protein n=1 Tax=Anguilla anguilla TaxID=7936 RepID=A0A0E9S9B1_ANGAN
MLLAHRCGTAVFQGRVPIALFLR